MREKILEMIGITRTYPGVKALDNVNFDLEKGEVHIIAGENGAGKSTLLKILSGAERMDSGKIKIFGRQVDISSPRIAQTLGISMVHQKFNLISTLSIADNIFLGREPFHKKSRLINSHILKTRARLILDMLRLKRNINTLVSELTPQEQKIVKVAKALSFDARIIGFDEPSSSLSKKELDNLSKLIKVIKLRELGVIYVSHRLDEVYELGDRVSILRDGVLVDTEPVTKITKSVLMKKMIGKELKQKSSRAKPKKKKVLIRLEDVCGENKLKNVNLEIYQREVLGITGLVGSGRTELAKIIFGADKKLKGNIFIDGEKVNINSPYDAIKSGIGFLTEDRNINALIPEMNISANITLANLRAVAKYGFIRKKNEKEVTSNYINELKIETPSIDEIISNLSEGNRQKIILARWLFANSRVLIFDEPTKSVHVTEKLQIYKLIKNLISRGIAVVIISSELPEILNLCDRIVVMREGTIAGIISKEEAAQEKIMNLAGG